jgi:hypothetical protein
MPEGFVLGFLIGYLVASLIYGAVSYFGGVPIA